jgi:Transketolase, pyrimidine binding domain
MDRGGLVGADGATHCGAFDVTYMATLPNMIVMAPSDEAELIHMVGPPFALCLPQHIGLFCTGSAQVALSIPASCSCTCCLLTTHRQTCALCHDALAPSFCGLYAFAPDLSIWLQVATAAAMDKHPICFRFPRGNGVGVDLAAAGITGFKGVPMEVRLASILSDTLIRHTG